MTSTERESPRMQLFDHPSGRPLSSSACFSSLCFAPPSIFSLRLTVKQDGLSEISEGQLSQKQELKSSESNLVFGTGFDNKIVLDLLVWSSWGNEVRRWFGEHPARHGRAVRRYTRKGQQPIKSSEKSKCSFFMHEHPQLHNTDSYNRHSSLRKHIEVSP